MFSHQIHPLLSVAVLLRCRLRAARARAAVQFCRLFSCAYKTLHRRSSVLISYLSQCSVHGLDEAIQVSCLGCLVSSETAILEQTHCLRWDQQKATF